MKLYELGESYRLITRRIEESEEDETSLFEAALGAMEDAIETKAESIIVMAKEWEGEASVLKEEEDRLSKRRKALENRAKGIKKYLLSQLVVLKIAKLKTKLLSLTVNKPRISVEIEDINLVPEEFIRVNKEAEKSAIKRALENGAAIPGVRMSMGEPSLTVR